MRQVLMNNKGVFIARVPRPTIQANKVLVKLDYSMISTGTETAGLRSQLQAASKLTDSYWGYRYIHSNIVRSKTALRYLYKALCHPNIAKHRLKILLKQKFGRNTQEMINGKLQYSHNETVDIGWNIGYSAVGEIIAVGEGVNDLSVGDKVACAGAGIANHADIICVSRNLVCPLPQGCDLISASSTTIGTIAMQGVRRAHAQLGDNIAIIGLGLLGQISSQLLQSNGCKVIGFDLNTTRVNQALDLGMHYGTSDENDLKHQVNHLTHSHGVDIAIITAATTSNTVINLAMTITRRKGKVVIVGDVGLNVEREQFYRKEIDLLMSTSYGPGRYDANYEESCNDYPYGYVRWTSNRNMRSYLELIASQKITINPLISKVVKVEDAANIYQELALSPDPPLSVVLDYESIQEAYAHDSKITIRGHRAAADVPINYALIGVGAFGTSVLVPAFNHHGKVFFHKGVVSRDVVRGGNYARMNELELLATDIQAVTEDNSIQLVVIATKHHEHADQVITSLTAGKHVFVEKPLATTWEQLDRICECVESINEMPMLIVGFNRRFSPAMQILRQQLAKRKSPLVINYRLNGGYIPLNHWIQTFEGGGRNIGEACHIYDCFKFLTQSKVCKIDASAINPGQKLYSRSDNFVATLSYEDGSIASLTYTAMGPKQGLAKESMEVFCDHEAYILDDYRSLLQASNSHILWSGATDKGHAQQIKKVAESLTQNTVTPISLEEIFEATAVSLHIEDLIHGRL